MYPGTKWQMIAAIWACLFYTLTNSKHHKYFLLLMTGPLINGPLTNPPVLVELVLVLLPLLAAAEVTHPVKPKDEVD
jgi:hypothetical protein